MLEKLRILERTKLKKIFVATAKIAISVLLLYFVFKKIPFYDVAKIIEKVHWFWLILGALFFLFSQIISTKRLEFYLKAQNFNLSFRSNLELYFLGMFYNFFIPGGIGGDAYKIYILHKKFDWSVGRITSSLFNDRLSGLLAIFILIVFLAMPLLESKWFFLGLTLIVIGIGVVYFFTKKLFKVYKSIFFKTLFISTLIQILQIVSFIFLLKSIGMNNNLTFYSLVFLLSSILSLISFAGIGIREMLFLQASEYFNFLPQFSISASLLFTIITAFFSFFGILMQIIKLHLTLDQPH